MEKKIKEIWDLTLRSKKQQEIISSMQKNIIKFAGRSICTKQLVSKPDLMKCRKEFMTLLRANSKERTFPPKFLRGLVEKNNLLPRIKDFSKHTLTPKNRVIPWFRSRFSGCFSLKDDPSRNYSLFFKNI